MSFVVVCGDCCFEFLDADRCTDRRASSRDDGSRESIPFVPVFCRLFACDEWANMRDIRHYRQKIIRPAAAGAESVYG